MLTGGKPERVPSSQIDWVKAPWSSGLHVWESDEPKESRVARFIESFDTPESPVPTFTDPSVPARALALCAGYGGLERGVNLANEQTETVCYVERQAYAASVLIERMRQGDLVQAPIWDELETFDAKRWRGNVDIVIAGIPCQGASIAGKRKGVADARWLWPVVWKITQDVGASWLFVENVPGLLSVNGGGAFAEVLRDLGARGWACQWVCVSAASVGAPHLRERLFLLAANPDRVAVRQLAERDQRRGRRVRTSERGNTIPDDDGARRETPDADGARREGRDQREPKLPEPSRFGGASSSADADGERRIEGSTNDTSRYDQWSDASRRGSTVTDPASERRDEEQQLHSGPRSEQANAGGGDQLPPRTRDAADADRHGPQGQRDGRQLDQGVGTERGGDSDGRGSTPSRHAFERIGAILDAGRAHWDWGSMPLSTFRRVDDGSSERVGGCSYADELHLLGNGVVSQAAAVAYLILSERLFGSGPDELVLDDHDTGKQPMTKRAKAKKTSRKATQATKASAKNGSKIPKAGGAVVAGTDPCVCGDAPEAHGRDPKYPGSTSCTVEGCECIAYEPDPQDELEPSE